MGASIRTVNAATLANWLKDGTATVIDVREPEEHRTGHIPGSVLVPLSSFDAGKIPLAPTKHLVFHCHLGKRCGPASERMAAAGFKGVIFRLEGGFMAWAEAGGKVETGD